MKKLFFPALFFTVSLSINAQDRQLTLEDIWSKGKFSQKYVQGLRSMNDGLHYTNIESTDSTEEIVQYEYKTGKKKSVILSSTDLDKASSKKISMDDYSFSPKEDKLLIITETTPIYRHSSKENNYIYDLSKKTLFPLSDGGKQMYATFSADASNVAFVRDNNLFVKNIINGVESKITTDGENNKIINGALDWVYEEEFSFSRGFEWSPDGSKIAFYKFDESRVKEYAMPVYGKLYPTEYRFKYPKAGEDNSIVTLHVYDMKTGKTLQVNTGTETDQYIPRIKWTNDPNVLSFMRLNRHQNKLELLLANALDGGSKVILTEENNTYVDIHDNLIFLKDNKSFIWTSEKDGFNHLYLYSLDGSLLRQITKGDWEVTGFEGIDEKSNVLYYSSTEASILDRTLYSIKLDGTGKKKLSEKKGTNNSSFSSGMKYFINNWSDANTPLFISLHSSDGKQIRVLQDNKALNDTLKVYKLPAKEFFTFTTSENISLNGWMIKPASFDPNKKYPVFMTLYGGPGSNTVTNSWGGGATIWYHYLAQHGYIVVSVDNRGTGSRGEAFKKVTYKQLGKYETMDQIEAAKYLGGLSYVDKSRIGIQGWSYGGYMSSLCMTKGADYFKAGIAVAPVTNWRYYDNIYTERFLQTPQENPQGYGDNSPINFVDKLKGKYLLIHGTGDDNVHFQNSAEMVTALVKANKQFDSFYYPNKNHGIYGGNTTLHLYTMMTNFLLENL